MVTIVFSSNEALILVTLNGGAVEKKDLLISKVLALFKKFNLSLIQKNVSK